MKHLPDSAVGDRTVTLPCICGRRYDASATGRPKCPHCGRVWEMEGSKCHASESDKRLRFNVKDAWNRRDRQYPQIPDLKTPWKCETIPYPPDPACV